MNSFHGFVPLVIRVSQCNLHAPKSVHMIEFFEIARMIAVRIGARYVPVAVYANAPDSPRYYIEIHMLKLKT